MNVVDMSYEHIINEAKGTKHYLLVKACSELMRSFNNISSFETSIELVKQSGLCAENYAIQVKRYLKALDDDY